MITRTEIQIALCCGLKCRTDTGHCHQADYVTEAQRVLDMLKAKLPEAPTLIVMESEGSGS